MYKTCQTETLGPVASEPVPHHDPYVRLYVSYSTGPCPKTNTLRKTPFSPDHFRKSRKKTSGSLATSTIVTVFGALNLSPQQFDFGTPPVTIYPFVSHLSSFPSSSLSVFLFTLTSSVNLSFVLSKRLYCRWSRGQSCDLPNNKGVTISPLLYRKEW